MNESGVDSKHSSTAEEDLDALVRRYKIQKPSQALAIFGVICVRLEYVFSSGVFGIH